MKNYTVKRNETILMQEVRAHTEEDAIEQVQDRYIFDNFGQAGALTESDVSKENDYLKAEFTAEEESEPTKDGVHIDFILTYFVGEQESFQTVIDIEDLKNEETLKNLILEQLNDEQAALLCKVSCCAYTTTDELPKWYLEANGKLWFNDHKRAQYGLD